MDQPLIGRACEYVLREIEESYDLGSISEDTRGRVISSLAELLTMVHAEEGSQSDGAYSKELILQQLTFIFGGNR